MLARNQEINNINKKETLEDFYNKLKITRPEIPTPSLRMIDDIGHFNVFNRAVVCTNMPSAFSRRDFYKISLIIGNGILHYPDAQIEIKGRALLFTNPNIPYSWESTSLKPAGYFCLFTENFIHSRNESLRDSLMWRINDNPVIHVDEAQEQTLVGIFSGMMKEMDGDYVHKYDLLRNYVHLLVHEALKIKPQGSIFKQNNASVRLTSLFMELLERQFPIGSTEHVLELKTAHDFSQRLSVHVNHLNHTVKEVTGKTTSEHIAKRITTEAIALLRNTEWNISEIAYCLGFEYPANFNIFFKRQLQCTPKAFRTS
ncbi:AraC-like DNA-binding protein [Pedobacter psychrotolerans]|uniref:AraC family transcriptional regulator n=1 Tax=Pedobacter psychrotolerans TaxID=1843235 RepID=A0A4R2HMF2_9SPHI|nr:helix-turn-helix transcriptional regulator [Pedobacter psychrotolerans]TCO31340.1 AraC-like DNA-binding protein [Pedobacter psychrotolerans]GGE40461.1 AraC family transcriptional regulator [Pedobacter psychrotolerans]